jgi:integrase
VQLKPSTRQRYAGLLRVNVPPTWRDRPLSSVSNADVQAWVTKLSSSGPSGSTVRQAFGVLAGLVVGGAGQADPEQPSGRGAATPEGEADKRFLSADEVARLADGAGDQRAVVLLLSYVGLRFGELAALRVRRVDLMRRRIEIAESVTEVNGALMFGTPKAHQRRSVPLPRFLVDELAPLLAGKRPSDLLFTAP